MQIVKTDKGNVKIAIAVLNTARDVLFSASNKLISSWISFFDIDSFIILKSGITFNHL